MAWLLHGRGGALSNPESILIPIDGGFSGKISL
jgi:hypothetical protein